MNRRHMSGDHHGRTARRATPLVTAADEILGTHRMTGSPPYRATRTRRAGPPARGYRKSRHEGAAAMHMQPARPHPPVRCVAARGRDHRFQRGQPGC
jgi:hypothetical protein